MPADYDMYFDYKNEYNEDDFFYHMYFDEVSTTPLPDEFYDILHSVSTGVKAPIVAKSPDYESLLANRNIGRHNFTSRLPGAAATTKGGAVAMAPTWVLTTQEAAEGEHGDEIEMIDGDTVATAPSATVSVTQFNVGRNITQFGRRAETETETPPRATRNSKQSRWRRATFQRGRLSRVQKKKKKAANNKKRNSKRNNLKWTLSSKGTAAMRKRKRKKQKQDPRIVGILDLRPPAYFKSNLFVPILLESFIVLSTGIAPVGKTTCAIQSCEGGSLKNPRGLYTGAPTTLLTS
jgi:hypothetical protein